MGKPKLRGRLLSEFRELRGRLWPGLRELGATILVWFLVLGFVFMPLGLMDIIGVSPGDVLEPDKEPIIEVLRVQSRDGTVSPYRHVAEYLTQALLEDDALEIDTVYGRPTTGSFHTLTEIEAASEDTVRIGIVQSDVLYHYTHGGHPQFFTIHGSEEMRAIAKVLHEWLQVLVKPSVVADSFPRPPSDLVSRADRVCSGSVGSGHLVTALNVERVLRASWGSISDCETDSGPNFALRVLSPPPEGKTSEDVGLRGDWKLIGLAPMTARLLMHSFPGVYEKVTADDIHSRYPALTESSELQTVSVDAILVTSRTPDAVVESIWWALERLELKCTDCKEIPQAWRDHWEIDCEQVPTALDTLMHNVASSTTFCDLGIPDTVLSRVSKRPRFLADLGGRVRSLPIQEHRVNIKHKLKDPLSRFLAPRVTFERLRGLILLTVGILMAYSFRQVRRVKRSRHGGYSALLPRFGIGLGGVGLFIIAHIAIAVLLWVGELTSRELLVDSTFVGGGILKGFEAVGRFVIEGRFGAEFRSPISMICVYILNAGWIVAAPAFTIQAVPRACRFIKEVMPMEGHVVIFGTNERSDILIEELNRHFHVRGEPGDYREIAFTAPFGGSEYSKTMPAYRRIPVESRDEAIDLANLKRASAAIVLADNGQAKKDGEPNVDLWVSRFVREILDRAKKLKLLKEGEKKKFHLIAEVVCPDNVDMAIGAGADEVVCASSFAGKLMAHASSRPHVTCAYSQLLKSERTSNEFYYDPVANKMVGWRFDRAQAVYVGKDRIPIGIRREQEVVINPDKDREIEEGDELVVIAQKVLQSIDDYCYPVAKEMVGERFHDAQEAYLDKDRIPIGIRREKEVTFPDKREKFRKGDELVVIAQRLLRSIDDSSEVYCEPVANELVGKRFHDAEEAYRDKDRIPIGIRHKINEQNTVMINPAKGTRIREGDKLVVIAPGPN